MTATRAPAAVFYPCELHKKAWPRFGGLRAHYQMAKEHKDGPRPKQEEWPTMTETDIPDDYAVQGRVVDDSDESPPDGEGHGESAAGEEPPEERRPVTRRTEESTIPRRRKIWEDEDTEPVSPLDRQCEVLDNYLIAATVEPANRKAAIRGFRLRPDLHDNPNAFGDFITPYIPQNYRGQIRGILQGMFPRWFEPPGGNPGYMPMGYQPPQPAPPWTGSPPWGAVPYPPPPWGPPNPGWGLPPQTPPQNEEAKQLRQELRQLREDMAERERKREEDDRRRDEEDRRKESEEKIGALAKAMDDKFKELGENIGGIYQAMLAKDKDAAIAALQTDRAAISEEMKALRLEMAGAKTAELKAQFEAQAKEMQAKLEAATRDIQRLQAEKNNPTGKTTEDLISDAILVGARKVGEFGDGVKEELKGIREAATSGKMPAIIPRGNNDTTAQGLSKVAEKLELERQIAGIRALG